jgi:SNF2 family DNA or RNA helicase
MNLEFEILDDMISIRASGMTGLRLLTELKARLRSRLHERKQTILLPLATLYAVRDLLPAEITTDPRVVRFLDSFTRHEAARERARHILESEEGGAATIDATWRAVLEPAQATAVAVMTLPNILGVCLFDEQGSGKTAMAIASFDILREAGLIDVMIVVCPKSMISEWPNDIKKFTGDKYKIICAEGTSKQKYDTSLENFDVLVTNYEGVEVMISSLAALAKERKVLLTADESYYLKNQHANRSAHVASVRRSCARCFVLCGTPAPNSASDLVNQFNLADNGYTFGTFSSSGVDNHDRDRIAELTESRGLFIRRMKSEILQHVPDKNFNIISVDLKDRQAKMYDDAKRKLVLELQSLNNETFKRHLTSYFAKRAALMQICCCPSAIDAAYAETPAKYDCLDNLLTELIGKNRKVVVWSFYKKSIDEMVERYRNYKPVRIDGSVGGAARRNAVAAFQNDPSVMLFIGNPAAAGAGITLHSAYDSVYLSYSNQAAHYLQSLDRTHRRGQVANAVNYYLIVCRGTVEEAEVVRLRQKEIQQHNVLGDHISWPTSLDEALSELTSHD